jgi:Holliday junction resolvasome RuvABC endonuclease subunit
MITLGLDPSLTGFGWCIHNSSVAGPGRIVLKGRQSTSPREIFVERYMRLRDFVGQVLDERPEIEAVGMESPIFGESFSPGAFGLFVMVNETVYKHRKDVVYFDPSTLKSLAKMDGSIRKGKMGKGDMVQAARVDSSFRGRFNHDEADAYHVARFAARFWELDRGLLKESDLMPSELHTFLRTHTYKKGDRAGETVKCGTLFKENDRFFRFSQVEKSYDPASRNSIEEQSQGRRKK